MKKYPADFWNDRYDASEFIYGTEPNNFFKEQLAQLEPGNVLLPADGEGRNGIYAATEGWSVTSFDISSNGRDKALQLAKKKKVMIQYDVADVMEFHTEKRFDVLALIYVHFPKAIRKKAHQRLLEFIKPNGIVIFEAFSKAQLGNASGGPENEEMLFSIEEVKDEFHQLDFKLLQEETLELNEGKHHFGTGEVIRFVGVK